VKPFLQKELEGLPLNKAGAAVLKYRSKQTEHPSCNMFHVWRYGSEARRRHKSRNNEEKKNQQRSLPP